MNHTHDMKLYLINGLAFALSLTQMETFLRFTLLILSIAYTVRKLLEKNKNDD